MGIGSTWEPTPTVGSDQPDPTNDDSQVLVQDREVSFLCLFCPLLWQYFHHVGPCFGCELELKDVDETKEIAFELTPGIFNTHNCPFSGTSVHIQSTRSSIHRQPTAK